MIYIQIAYPKEKISDWKILVKGLPIRNVPVREYPDTDADVVERPRLANTILRCRDISAVRIVCPAASDHQYHDCQIPKEQEHQLKQMMMPSWIS
ncbi:MAG: hypothetical protein LUQ66_08015 [Methanoregula sp.]|nr:hypothetical protein [Methanoregula sp.]